MTNPTGKGGWAKGQSGNPGGRPKEVGHVRDLARLHTEQAINTLAEIMQDDSERASARVAAAEALLARGWGRPLQTVEIDQPMPSDFPLDLSDEIALLRSSRALQ